jgi:Zn finger protein HypA/HybF involved in hydrogenase expression
MTLDKEPIVGRHSIRPCTASILQAVSEHTACCRDRGAPREIPVNSESVCPACGSANVALSDSDSAKGYSLVALKAREDQGEPEPVVACKDCGAQLDESAIKTSDERRPCPGCGSLARHVSMAFGGKVTVGAQLALKAKNGATGKWFLKQKQGDSFSTERGRFMRLLQVVDRRNNCYRKLVTDPETGEVLRDVDEPLSDHQGYGDAKPKR